MIKIKYSSLEDKLRIIAEQALKNNKIIEVRNHIDGQYLIFAEENETINPAIKLTAIDKLRMKVKELELLYNELLNKFNDQDAIIKEIKSEKAK
jgi:hypothetical protein